MTLCYSTGPLEGTQPPTIPIVTVPPTPNYDYPHACLDINFPERWNPVCAPWIQPSETLREGLINTNWSIVSMNGTMISTPATLDFGTRTMQVSICNSLIGSYHAIKNKLFTQRFISTRIYCENDGMAVENAMRHATRSHASISGDILTLHTREGNIIIWQRR